MSLNDQLKVRSRSAHGKLTVSGLAGILPRKALEALERSSFGFFTCSEK